MKVNRKIKYVIEKIKYVFGMKGRWDIFKILPQNAVCAELGVFKGEFSEAILTCAKPKECHFVDVWWSVFGEYYPDWGIYTNNGKLTTRSAYETAASRIKRFSGNNTIHVGSDLDYLQTFPDQYFDWAYIDSSHEYDHTKSELAILSRKIKTDGIICGHDWHNDSTHVHYGVRLAIEEFCSSQRWEVFYTDGFMQWAIRRSSL
jgi:hypothetical protein